VNDHIIVVTLTTNTEQEAFEFVVDALKVASNRDEEEVPELIRVESKNVRAEEI
jgi:hypothetical protein